MANLLNTEVYIEEMVEALDLLLKKWSYPSSELVFQLQSLRTYFYCCLGLKINDQENNSEQQLKQLLLDFHGSLIRAFYYGENELTLLALLESIEQLKFKKIREDCLNFLNCPLRCNFHNHKLLPFVRGISANLISLLECKLAHDDDVKKLQIQSLKDNLDLFCEVFDFAVVELSCHFEEFKVYFQTLAWRTASLLSLPYWVVDETENGTMCVIVSDLYKQSSPFTPEVTRMYLKVLIGCSRRSQATSFMARKVVHRFVRFLKDNMKVDPEQHLIQMFFVDLIFIITFLMDWREVAMELPEGELNLRRVVDLACDVVPLISSFSSDESLALAEHLLHNFLEKAKAVKMQVRKTYIHLFPDSSSFSFPIINVNVLRFIDSLLENFKYPHFNYPKLPITMLREELLSTKKSYLEDFTILEMQNKHKEMQYLLTRIVKVAYNAKRAANAFIYMEFLWHDILHFFDVIEEFKLVNSEMKRIRDHHPMYDDDDIHASDTEKKSESLLLQANVPIAEDQVVGFKDEVKLLVDRLVGGLEELDIVSIVGMPGLGKTTLATKIYASVKYHFHKHAWCNVSQTFDRKRMLLDILRCIGVRDNDLPSETEEDLEHRVYRSLKGRRYLIVMDDIWDVKAWNVLKWSFPDDKLGSRIIFTSRIRDLVLEAKTDCVPFPLKPLTEKESWELLQKKLFDQNCCPRNFAETGKHIARKCKGLPLSIILVAGLLKKNIKNLNWWKQVGERLDLLIANEDCKGILELSYTHLPDFLKSIFLYFGSLPVDEDINVNALILLWISEGFIEMQANKSLEFVAEEYFMDLVGRSLVIVTQLSSMGRIKACRVHDLIHEFCLRKGEEENILKVFNEKQVSFNPHYRVCIGNECWKSFLEDGSHAPFLHSLLPFPNSYPLQPWGNLGPEDFIYITSHFRFLEVLYLGLGSSSCRDFPEAITELVLLKCLMIMCNLESVPPSIKKLKNLETLILEHLYRWRFQELRVYDCFPLAILEIQKLKHLYVLGSCIAYDFCDAVVPPLENLQTFSCPGFLLKHKQTSDTFLRKIPKVEKLKYEFEYCGPDVDLVLKWDFLSHLESLTVTQSRDCLWHSYELHFPSTLKKLHLVDFNLLWSAMPAISKLPNLEVLKLDGGILGDTWNVEDEEFQNLKFLRLRDLEIEQLNVSDDSFPCLERFIVQSCNYLKEIPLRFASIFTLKMIQVGFHLKSSATQIEEEQKEQGNEVEVLISRGF